MSRKHLLSGMVLCVLVCEAQAQGLGPPRGRDGIALTQIPAIIVVGQADDARVALVRAGVAHWNQLLAGIGSGFRLGQVSLGRANQAGEVGKIAVVLAYAELIAKVRRLPDGQGAVAMIRNTNGPPMSLPNVARNVIAHELGHAIGLGHNSDPTMLMCGRPAPCRPGLFASPTTKYFPLSAADRGNLLTMYPTNWRPR